MAKNTSILLDSHFDNFISSEIASGRYKSASEVIRSALRLLENEEDKIKKLRLELEEGEKSGFVESYNATEHLIALQNKYLQD